MMDQPDTEHERDTDSDVDAALLSLGWNDSLAAAWHDLGAPGTPRRVIRLDRGWSSIVGADGEVHRVRNIGADVAAGDWVIASDDGERVDHVIERNSAFIRRASFEGARAEAHTLAANVDVAFLLHALTTPPNPRRIERELVLAFDSGAKPVLVLTKLDAVEPDVAAAATAFVDEIAAGVDLRLVSSRAGSGLDAIAGYAAVGRTLAFLGKSGVGKSTLINALVGRDVQATANVRVGDDRGRHTTVAAELVPLPIGGWLIDTPGLRAISLWSSGRGIERAFPDIFDLTDQCRFRNCKHEDEPGCAVQAAIVAGTLDPRRLVSMKHLVAEELALEDEQRDKEKDKDKRHRKPRTSSREDTADDDED